MPTPSSCGEYLVQGGNLHLGRESIFLASTKSTRLRRGGIHIHCTDILADGNMLGIDYWYEKIGNTINTPAISYVG